LRSIPAGHADHVSTPIDRSAGQLEQAKMQALSNAIDASAGLDHTVRVPSLMIMAENDAVLPPSAADGMEKLVPDLEKYLVKDSGHWTQQEKPDEVSAKLIEWRRKRFG
jgi:pimeloyl-ACP methyl ester carboxylesterase